MSHFPSIDTIGHAFRTSHTIYETYVAPQLPTPIRMLVTQLFNLVFQIEPYVSQAMATVTASLAKVIAGSGSGSSSSGGTAEASALVSTVVLVFTFYAGIKILNYVRRTILGWVFLGFKLALVVIAVQAVMYVNVYGWDKFLRDVGWWGGLVWGFVQDALLDGGAGGDRVGKGTRGQVPRAARSRSTWSNNQVPLGGGAGGGRWT